MLSHLLNTASHIGSSVRRARLMKPSYLLSSRAAFDNTLGHFTFELPDLNQDLRVQKRSSETFKLFSSLPMELRLMIWKLSLPEGRLIDMEATLNELYIGDQGRSRRPFPDTLFVNSESRRELSGITLSSFLASFRRKTLSNFLGEPLLSALDGKPWMKGYFIGDGFFA